MTFRLTCFVIASFVFGSVAQAQILATYDFTTTTSNALSVAPTPPLPTGGTVSNLTRGDGITAPGFSIAGQYSAVGYTLGRGGLDAAIATNEYMSFTLTADPGNTIRVSSLFLGINGSALGPLSIAIQTSATGFGTDDSNIIGLAAVTSTSTGHTFDLSAVNQALIASNAGVLEFRIYGYNSSFGNFNLIDVGGTNGLTVTGSFVPVPEPGTIFGLGATILGIGAFVRRKYLNSGSVSADPEVTV